MGGPTKEGSGLAVAAERILQLPELTDSRSDKALIRAAQAGDHNAASTLVHRYYPRIHRFVRHLTNGRGASEDLTQEVFARALTHLPTFNGQYKFEHWLLRVAKNLCIDEARRSVRRPEPTDPHDLSELEGVPGADYVWESISARMATAVVHSALQRLPARQRTVLVLRELEGMSYADISRVVGTNIRGVEATLRRARIRFRYEVASSESMEEARAFCTRILKLLAADPPAAFANEEASRHLRECWECRARFKAINNADKLFGIVGVPAAAAATEGLPWFRVRDAAESFLGSVRDYVASPIVQIAGSVALFASVATAQVLTPAPEPAQIPAPAAVVTTVETTAPSGLSVPATTAVVPAEDAAAPAAVPGASGAGRATPAARGPALKLPIANLTDIEPLARDSLATAEQASAAVTEAASKLTADAASEAQEVVAGAKAKVDETVSAPSPGVKAPAIKSPGSRLPR